jgi:ribulose-phosphate 3-epimerase
VASVQIAASIAAADQSRLGWAVEEATRAGADVIHLDLEDGVFLPNITFGPSMVRALRSWSDLPFDVHVELVNPEPYLEDLARAGANGATVHAEACPYLHRTVCYIRDLGMQAGVAFNLGSALDPLLPVLEDVAVINLMTCDPDRDGQRFVPAVLPKISQAARLVRGRQVRVQVDGGINAENIRAVVQAGASTVVIGRAIWQSADPARAITELRAAAAGARTA